MRRRLVYLATVPLYWPLELMASMGHLPSLRTVHVHLALVRAVQFVLDAILLIDRGPRDAGRTALAPASGPTHLATEDRSGSGGGPAPRGGDAPPGPPVP